MTEKSYGREVVEELVRKAVVWGPPIAGGLLLGPVGVIIGVATTSAILGEGRSDNGAASHGSDQGSKSKD